jgi:hypothetical protein
MKMDKINDAIDTMVSGLMDKGATVPEIYGGICTMKRTLDTLLALDTIETLDRLRAERLEKTE